MEDIQKFKTYTPLSAVFGIIFGFIIVIPSAWLVFREVQHADSVQLGLLVPGIFILFFLYMLTMSAIKFFTVYYVSPCDLTLHKPPFYRRTLNETNIKSIQLLSEEDTTKLMAHSLDESNQEAQTGNIPGYFGSISKSIPQYRYFTNVPKPFVSSSSDPKEMINPADIKSRGKAVVLELKPDGVLYLSPINAEEFVNSIEILLRP